MANPAYPTAQQPAPRTAQQPAQSAYGGSYYAQRNYNYGYQQRPAAAAKPEQNLQPVYIGLGLIAVVAIISIALLAFGGGGEERFDPALSSIGANEEARVLVYCTATCDEDVIEDLGGSILTRFQNENAVLIVIKGSKLKSLLDESWVRRLASPL